MFQHGETHSWERESWGGRLTRLIFLPEQMTAVGTVTEVAGLLSNPLGCNSYIAVHAFSLGAEFGVGHSRSMGRYSHRHLASTTLTEKSLHRVDEPFQERTLEM